MNTKITDKGNMDKTAQDRTDAKTKNNSNNFNISDLIKSMNPAELSAIRNMLAKDFANKSKNKIRRKNNKQIQEQKRRRILFNKQKRAKKNKNSNNDHDVNTSTDKDSYNKAVKIAKKRKPQIAQGQLKYHNASTPCSRHRVSINRSTLYNGSAFRALTTHLKKHGCRNQNGRRTIIGRSGKLSHKRRYRLIDFSRRFFDNVEGVVKRIEYDPNRSAFISLIAYDSSKLSQDQLSNLPKFAYHHQKDKNVYAYIIAPQDIAVGDMIYSQNSYQLHFTNGSSANLMSLPLGSVIHNIELIKYGSKFLCRSAGCFASLVTKSDKHVVVRLSSGEERKIPGVNRATLGKVSNEQHKHIKHGSAGKKRYLGYSSTTRGVAKNPVAHHNGGRTHGGKILCNARGHMRKGLRTRSKKKQSNAFIVKSRHNKNRRGK